MGSSNIWTTSIYRQRDRFDIWHEKLNELYGRWNSQKPPQVAFSAQMSHRKIDEFQIVECRCDPCGAARPVTTPHHEGDELLAIQLVLQGTEEFSFGDRRALLKPGDILLWDTLRSMTFKVIEPLHKVSVMIPLTRVRDWLPREWNEVGGRVLSSSASAEFLSDYISSVSPRFLDGELNNSEGLVQATIGLLINALDLTPRPGNCESLRDAQLYRIYKFIDAHIDDQNLSPAQIAAACRISLRYLHCLFKNTDSTVVQFIIQQRLSKCRRDLSNPMMAHRTIMQIAYSAGFMSSTHFTKRFKTEFGMTPHDFRAQSSKHPTAKPVSDKSQPRPLI